MSKVSNTRYVRHEVIMAKLARLKLDKKFDTLDVLEWCQEVECNHIMDTTTMYQYIGVPLTVTDNQTLLPCNIWRLLDIYSNPNSSQSFIECSNNGAYLCNIPDGYTTIYVNYVGTPIDDDGVPLIAKGHENACVKYCLIQAFMNEYLSGILNANIYAKWEEEFSGLIANAQYNFRHRTRVSISNLNKIRGNMIPKIGQILIKQDA